MEIGYGEQAQSRNLGHDEHWKVQKRFKKDGDDGKIGTLQLLNLF